MRILTEKQTWRREPLRASVRNKLTLTEQANVRRAIAFLRIRMGGDRLAKAIGTTPDALRKAASPRRQQTVRITIAIAYVAGVKVEAITSGTWPRRSTCPHCGRGG